MSETKQQQSQLSSSASFASDLDLLVKSLDDFHAQQQGLDMRHKASLSSIDGEFRQLDDLVKAHKSQLEEYDRLGTMIRQLEKDAERSGSASSEDKAKLAQCWRQLAFAKDSLDRMKATKPRLGSVFLRFMMGHVNVKMWKRGDMLRFKEEYNKFKSRTTWIFILFPLVQLFIVQHRLIWIAHQTWLFYYYMTLALRENILQANGSDIKKWWIVHHYITMVITFISLVFPSPDVSKWIRHFLWFGLTQGLIMLVMVKYQSRRHYVRRALGKANEMDLDSSETIVEKPTGLKVLVPLLYGLYTWEIVFGVYYFYQHTVWEIFVQSLLFCLLGIGNAVTTTYVLLEKKRTRQRKKMLKTHAE